MQTSQCNFWHIASIPQGFAIKSNINVSLTNTDWFFMKDIEFVPTETNELKIKWLIYELKTLESLGQWPTHTIQTVSVCSGGCWGGNENVLSFSYIWKLKSGELTCIQTLHEWLLTTLKDGIQSASASHPIKRHLPLVSKVASDGHWAVYRRQLPRFRQPWHISTPTDRFSLTYVSREQGSLSIYVSSYST